MLYPSSVILSKMDMSPGGVSIALGTEGTNERNFTHDPAVNTFSSVSGTGGGASVGVGDGIKVGVNVGIDVGAGVLVGSGLAVGRTIVGVGVFM